MTGSWIVSVILISFYDNHFIVGISVGEKSFDLLQHQLQMLQTIE